MTLRNVRGTAPQLKAWSGSLVGAFVSAVGEAYVFVTPYKLADLTDRGECNGEIYLKINIGRDFDPSARNEGIYVQITGPA